MFHNIDIKRIIALLAAVTCLWLIPVSAYADGVPIGNFGELEEQEDTDSGEEGEDVLPKTVTLSNGSVYDTETRLFYFTVGTGRFGMSVPNGAIVTGRVSVVPDTALTCRLYLDGNEQTGVELTAISSPGSYVLAVTENDEAAAVRVGFTIVANETGAVSEYRMPDDFYVVSAMRNGETAVYTQSFVDMTAEGDYDILYRSPKAGAEFCLQVSVDHTPPALTLTGLTDNKANGPVTISDVEPGTQVYVLRNEKPIAFTNTLTETGIYTVTARDRAGNLTQYEFVIVAYLNANAWLFFAALGVLLIALAVYLFYSKKYMRVR